MQQLSSLPLQGLLNTYQVTAEHWRLGERHAQLAVIKPNLHFISEKPSELDTPAILIFFFEFDYSKIAESSTQT